MTVVLCHLVETYTLTCLDMKECAVCLNTSCSASEEKFSEVWGIQSKSTSTSVPSSSCVVTDPVVSSLETVWQIKHIFQRASFSVA